MRFQDSVKIAVEAVIGMMVAGGPAYAQTYGGSQMSSPSAGSRELQRATDMVLALTGSRDRTVQKSVLEHARAVILFPSVTQTREENTAPA